MRTENRCHSCGAEVSATRRRCPSCYVALGAASRAPAPLRAAPSATTGGGQLALAPSVVTEHEPTPSGVQCPSCEATFTPITGWCSSCMEPLPVDDSSSFGEPLCDFEDFDPYGDDPEPQGKVIIGPWPRRLVASDHVGGEGAVSLGTDSSEAAPKFALSYATWHQRALATLIDSVVFVPFVVATAVSATVALVLLTLAVAFSAWQVCGLQGRTGQTIGKRQVGLFLVREADLRPIGVRRAALRQLAHGIDAALLGVGFLWPLWDAKHQTFADQVFATVVVAG